MAASAFTDALSDGAILGRTPPVVGSGGTTLPAGLGPNFTGPLPASFGGAVQPGAAPSSGQTVYTAGGQGYTPTQLQAAWGDGNTAFAQDPANARVRDILPQYGFAPGAGVQSPVANAAPGVAGVGSGSPGASPMGAPTGMNDSKASAFFDTLMANLDKQPQVDANDPIIKAETDAYAANQTRAQRNILSQVAEAKGPYGSTGQTGISSEERLAAETAGQNTGTFEAGLMGQERDARRSQIQNILSLGGSFLTSEQSLALQKELNDMNLQQRAYEFDSNDAYRYSPFAAGAIV